MREPNLRCAGFRIGGAFAFGILFPAIARLFAGGTEGYILDFLRKNLLAQTDAPEDDLPILDSELR